MNQDLAQGNPYVQVPQKLSSLSNPTSYHLAAKSKRIVTNNGAPPTPNNSFQNNTLSSNNLPDSAIDSNLLQQFQHQQHLMNIKQESAQSEYDDYDVSSPLSNTACNSPHDQGFGSNSYEDFGRSYKPTSHIDSMMFGGANPLPTNSFSNNPSNSFPNNPFPTNSMHANTTIYEDFSTDNYTNPDDFVFSGDIAMSAPAPATSQIGQADVKANINNQKINYNRVTNNNLNNMGGHVSNMSHSLPSEWPYGTSLDSSNYQFTNSGEIQNYEADSGNDKEALASEKRRRRRESHNAVERRRRDNINEKIQELSTLLPELFVDSANKPNKGAILRKSVDYIRHLQHVYEQERNRSSKLESQVRELSSKTGNNPGSGSNGSDLNNSPGGGNIYGSSMP